MKYLNLATYKFIDLDPAVLSELKNQLQQQASRQFLKGTILLSPEGINMFLAGEGAAIHTFVDFVQQIPEFKDLWFKFSESTHIPFKRLFVRVKKEIITMNQPSIQPQQATAPYIEPAELQRWYTQHQDMIVLDTRNRYEVEVGTFKNAVQMNIEHFSEFPQAVAELPEEFKIKPIVTFCTGGIRCEKAAAYLLQQGFKQVWQLKGGILHYFEQCGGEHFSGDCFVFDQREAVQPPNKVSKMAP